MRCADPNRPWYVRVLDSTGACKAYPGTFVFTTNTISNLPRFEMIVIKLFRRPIFKVRDSFEDPDFRILEGSWCPGRGRSEDEVPEGVLRLFFRPREWKIEGGSPFFVPRKWKTEGSSFFGGRSPTPPPLAPSDLRPILRGRRSKMRGFFDLRVRRSKIEGRSTIFGSEERREKKGFSKNLVPFFGEPPSPLLRRTPSSKNPSLFLSSFFESEDRRTPPYL